MLWLGPLLALLAFLAPVTAHAKPHTLQDARDLFRAGQWDDAIGVLHFLLYPTSQLSDEEELAEAHLLLGVSYFEKGHRDTAAREFETALALNPTLSIDEAVYSTDAVRFFETKKDELERAQRAAREREQRARKRALKKSIIDGAFVLEKRYYYLNFIPFGTGQIQNGERGKGIFFAVSEGALGAASLGLFAYQLIQYPDGRVPAEEVGTVRNLQVLQISTGGLFFAVMGWGIIDALLNYEHTVQKELDPGTRQRIDEYIEDILPDDRQRPPPRRPPPTSGSSFRLTPTLLPDGGGVALSWEF